MASQQGPDGGGGKLPAAPPDRFVLQICQVDGLGGEAQTLYCHVQIVGKYYAAQVSPQDDAPIPSWNAARSQILVQFSDRHARNWDTKVFITVSSNPTFSPSSESEGSVALDGQVDLQTLFGCLGGPVWIDLVDTTDSAGAERDAARPRLQIMVNLARSGGSKVRANRIRVQVKRCEGLEVPQVMDCLDVYCRISYTAVSGKTMTVRTPVMVSQTGEVSWEGLGREANTFDLDDVFIAPNAALSVDLYDWDRFSGDDLLGSVKVSLGGSLAPTGAAWFELSLKNSPAGRILLDVYSLHSHMDVLQKNFAALGHALVDLQAQLEGAQENMSELTRARSPPSLHQSQEEVSATLRELLGFDLKLPDCFVSAFIRDNEGTIDVALLVALLEDLRVLGASPAGSLFIANREEALHRIFVRMILAIVAPNPASQSCDLPRCFVRDLHASYSDLREDDGGSRGWLARELDYFRSALSASAADVEMLQSIMQEASATSLSEHTDASASVQLAEAAARLDVESCEGLLSDHAAHGNLQVNALDSDKTSALQHMVAGVAKVSDECIELSTGAVHNNSALARHLLALAEKKRASIREVIRLLLERGANVNTSKTGTAPFPMACRNADDETIRTMVEIFRENPHLGPDPDLPCESFRDIWEAVFTWNTLESLVDGGLLRALLEVQAAKEKLKLEMTESGTIGAARASPENKSSCASPSGDEFWQHPSLALHHLFDKATDESAALAILKEMLKPRLDEERGEKFSLFNVNAVDDNGNSPLHLACELGYTRCAEELVACKMFRWDLCLPQSASTNDENGDGETPLMLAARGGHTELTSFLILEQGSSSSSSSGESWSGRDRLARTPLHAACSAYKGADDLVLFLLGMNVPVNAVDTFGRTALHYAATAGRVGAAQALLDAGADATLASHKDGRLPLHEAALHGRVNVLKLLLSSASADVVDAEDSLGRTALSYTLDRRAELEVTVVCLIEKLSETFRKLDYMRGEARDFVLSYAGEGGAKIIASMETANPHLLEMTRLVFHLALRSFGPDQGSAPESLCIPDRELHFAPACAKVLADRSDEEGLASVLRPVFESLHMDARRCNAMVALLLEAEADADHVDFSGDPAFPAGSRLGYYLVNREKLRDSFLKNRSAAHNQPIFKDKLMQKAIGTVWIMNGLRQKALFDLVYWIVVLVLLTFVAIRYSGHDEYEPFSIQATLADRLSVGEGGALDDIATLGDWESYVESVFLDTLWGRADQVYMNASGGVQHLGRDGPLLGGALALLGRPRYRQLRTRADGCVATMPSLLRQTDEVCFTPFTRGSFRRPGPALEDLHEVTFRHNGTDLRVVWENHPAFPVYGKYGYYQGGGLSIVLPTNRSAARGLLRDLHASDYLSLNTRFAALEFTLYSRAHGLFVHGTVFVEQTAAGGVFAGRRWETRKLASYISPSDRIGACLEGLLGVLLMWHFFKELASMFEKWDTDDEGKPLAEPPHIWVPGVVDLGFGGRARGRPRTAHFGTSRAPSRRLVHEGAGAERRGREALGGVKLAAGDQICIRYQKRVYFAEVADVDAQGRYTISSSNLEGDESRTFSGVRPSELKLVTKPDRFAFEEGEIVLAKLGRGQDTEGFILAKHDDNTYSVLLMGDSRQFGVRRIFASKLEGNPSFKLYELVPRNEVAASGVNKDFGEGPGVRILMALPCSHKALCLRKRAVSLYWADSFNYMDFTIIVLAVALMGAHVSVVRAVNGRLLSWHELSVSDEYVDVSDVLWLATVRQYILASEVFLCYLKTLEYVQVSAAFAIPVMIIGGMLSKLVNFFVIFAIFILAFGLFDFVLYGLTYEPTNSVLRAIIYTFRGALGDLDFDGKHALDQTVGTFMTLLSAVILVILLLNLLIAIMSEAYEEIKSSAEARWCFMQFGSLMRRESRQSKTRRQRTSDPANGASGKRSLYSLSKRLCRTRWASPVVAPETVLQ